MALSFFNVITDQVYFAGEENAPKRILILSAIRQEAPVSVDRLSGMLEGAGYEVPSRKWLMRQLDAARKRNQVVRLQSGEYALTLKTLKDLGSGKGHQSPDVRRALHLVQLGGLEKQASDE